jgi:hypothetical protein
MQTLRYLDTCADSSLQSLGRGTVIVEVLIAEYKYID